MNHLMKRKTAFGLTAFSSLCVSIALAQKHGPNYEHLKPIEAVVGQGKVVGKWEDGKETTDTALQEISVWFNRSGFHSTPIQGNKRKAGWMLRKRFLNSEFVSWRLLSGPNYEACEAIVGWSASDQQLRTWTFFSNERLQISAAWVKQGDAWINESGRRTLKSDCSYPDYKRRPYLGGESVTCGQPPKWIGGWKTRGLLPDGTPYEDRISCTDICRDLRRGYIPKKQLRSFLKFTVRDFLTPLKTTIVGCDDAGRIRFWEFFHDGGFAELTASQGRLTGSGMTGDGKNYTCDGTFKHDAKHLELRVRMSGDVDGEFFQISEES